MAGLINKQMNPQAEAGGMPAEQMGMGQAEGGEEEINLDDPAFLQAIELTMQALYAKGAAQDVAKQLRSSSDHVQALSDIAYEMTSVVDEQTQGSVPDDLIMMLAIKVLTEVGDIAEAAGIEITAPEIAAAFKDMLMRFLGENGVDTSQLDQAMSQIDPKVFEQAEQGA